MSQKVCKDCVTLRPISFFHKQSGGKLGRSARCKFCISYVKRKQRISAQQAKLRAKRNRSTFLDITSNDLVITLVPEKAAVTQKAFAELIQAINNCL